MHSASSASLIVKSFVVVRLCFFFLMMRRPPSSTLFPSTTLFRSASAMELSADSRTFSSSGTLHADRPVSLAPAELSVAAEAAPTPLAAAADAPSRDSSLPLRSEEHTSELQSQSNLVCRLLLEKKK